MQKLIIILISSLILLSSLSKTLRFSFTSLHDGYVYPYWKTKESLQGTFYEDAVVVRSKTITLGDGVGGSNGYSGFFSHYHCLKISEALQNLSSNSVSSFDVKQTVLKSINDNNYKLSQMSSQIDAATTLVYLYLKDEMLYTGVSGDSGYSIFRFSESQNKLLLHYRSKELVFEFNTPECILPEGVTKLENYSHNVQEGDVVLVASDGVLDVLPYSFLIAATNHLVRKMVIAFNYGGKIDENSYDLADLLEAYIQNLHKVSVKYANQLATDARKELKSQYLAKEETEEPGFFKKLFGCFSSAKKIKDPIYYQQLEKIKNFEESFSLTADETNSMMNDIYKNEICNNFFPFSYTTERIYEFLNKQCFENDNTSKATNHDETKSFECETLEELTYPLIPSKDRPHNFKTCVLKAIPDLPRGTTVNKIMKSFNARYFARNIGLAAKFMSKDTRVKIDDFYMKYIEHSKKTKKGKTPQQINAELLNEMTWMAKTDDISVAAAVLVDEDIFGSQVKTDKFEKINSLKSRKYAKSIWESFRDLMNGNYSDKILI